MGLQCFSHGFSFLRSGVTISGILGWLDSIPTEGKEIGARFHTIGLSDSAKVKFDRSIMSKIFISNSENLNPLRRQRECMLEKRYKKLLHAGSFSPEEGHPAEK